MRTVPAGTPAIILLAGPAQVGKSTTSTALALALRERGLKTQRLSFAGPLYEVTSRMTGLSVEQLHALKSTPMRAVHGVTPTFEGLTAREALQKIGEGMRQALGERVWIDMAMQRISRSADVVIFDDARHLAELRLGYVVELVRPGLTYAANHPSAMPPPTEEVGLRFNLDGYAPVDAGAALATFLLPEISRAG